MTTVLARSLISLLSLFWTAKCECLFIIAKDLQGLRQEVASKTPTKYAAKPRNATDGRIGSASLRQFNGGSTEIMVHRDSRRAICKESLRHLNGCSVGVFR